MNIYSEKNVCFWFIQPLLSGFVITVNAPSCLDRFFCVPSFFFSLIWWLRSNFWQTKNKKATCLTQTFLQCITVRCNLCYFTISNWIDTIDLNRWKFSLAEKKKFWHLWELWKLGESKIKGKVMSRNFEQLHYFSLKPTHCGKVNCNQTMIKFEFIVFHFCFQSIHIKISHIVAR